MRQVAVGFRLVKVAGELVSACICGLGNLLANLPALFAVTGRKSPTVAALSPVGMRLKLTMAAVIFGLGPVYAMAQALPNGAILDINNGNAANSASYTTPAQSNYSVSFTATATGINYILFAFRQDPAFWTFQDPELFVAGTSANLLTNSTFTTGGAIPNSSIQAPANWGVVYQTGSPPQAAGTWQAPTGAGSNGTWYDGAVGSFDGIYQGVSLTSGVVYTLTFSLKGDNSANSNDIRVGAFTGPCVSLSGPASSCTLPTSSGFTTLYTPAQTNNAGGPSTTTINASTNASGTTATNLFDGGTLVADGTDISSNQFSITGNGGVIDTHGVSTTIGTAISDDTSGVPGSLSIIDTAGHGTLSLSGSNTYTGSTNIGTNATLSLSGNGSIAASSGVTDNGTFDIAGHTGDISIQNLNGNGQVALGSNSLTLAGASGSFGGQIAGAGGITVASGSETLSGQNSYSGGTTVRGGGTLNVSSDANLGAASGTITLNDGTLHTTRDVTSARNITLAGNGAFNTDNGTTMTDSGTVGGTGGLIKNGAGTLELDGVASHQGGTTVNGGTLVLGGNNTYTGGTTVNGPGTLQVASDANLGDASSNLTLNGGTLHTTGDVTSARNITLAGNGTLNTDSGTTMTDSGTVSGTGGLIKNGAGTLELDGVASHQGGTTVNGGTLVLGGNNTYTGGTSVNGPGTLQVSSDANLGDASSNLTLNGGTLHTTGDVTSARNITLAGNGTLNTDSGTTMTDSGTVSGTGGLIKNGAGTLELDGVASHQGGTTVNGGTLVLGGNNTYTGGTSVNGPGTLQVSSDANLGDASSNLTLNGGTLHTTGDVTSARNITLAGNGTLNTDSGTTMTDSGTVSGTGGLIKNGAGTLELDGVASHQGGTTVNSGTLILGGNNTYTGGTTLNGGSLHVSSDANLGDPSNAITFHGGDLTVTQSMTTGRGMILGAEGASLTTLTGVTLVENGDMSGVGGLQKNGGGTLIVNGANTFTGGTLINGGVIQINSGSSLGTGAIVLNGGMLNTTATLGTGQQIIVSGASGVNVDEGTTTVLSGQIASSGDASCFTKMGKGTLSMTGSATLSHGTCVADGILRANGDLISDVSVYAAGTLRGVGLVNGSMNVDGRLAPGNSPGTLVVNGTVTMNSGSVFEADVDGTGTGTGAGNYSRLLVTGAGHQFIANGTLQPLLRNITGNASNTFVPNLGDTYRIVTAEGGIAGRFSGLDQPAEGLAAGTRFQAFYNVLGSNSIDLRVTPLTYAGYLSGSNGNVRSVAGLLDATMTSQDAATTTDRQSQLLYAVAGADAAQLPQVAKGLVGEIHADMAAAAPEAGRATQQQVTDHLMNGPATDATHGEMLWANVSHTNDHTSADEHASGFTARNNQVTVGADIMRSAATRVGIGFSHADVVVSTDGGSGSIQDNLGFIYGQQSVGNVLMDGMFGYGAQSWSSNRSDVIGMTNGLSTGNHGHDILASVGVRLPVLLTSYRLEPFARAIFQHIQRDGNDEGDASVSALTLNDYSASGTRLLAGLSGGSISQDPLMQFATYKFNVALGTDTGSLIRTSVDASLVGQPLSVQAPHSGRVFGQFGLGGTLRVAKQGYLFAGAQTEVAARRTSYSLTGGIRIGF